MGTFQHPSSGEVLVIDDVTLHSSAARTATYTATGVAIGDKGTLRLLLDVTAASGTSPTIDVAVQTSYDNSTWRAVASFAQLTAAGSERKSFTGIDRYARIVATIGGTTPSFTFSVSGEAV